MAVLELIPRLMEDCRPLSCPESADAKTIFANMAYHDLCRDANLKSAIVYARGSRSLQIPEGWRELLPNQL